MGGRRSAILGFVVAATMVAGAFPAAAVPDHREAIRQALDGFEPRKSREAPRFLADAGWPADAVPGRLLVTTTDGQTHDLAARLWKSPHPAIAQATAIRLTDGVSRVWSLPATRPKSLKHCEPSPASSQLSRFGPSPAKRYQTTASTPASGHTRSRESSRPGTSQPTLPGSEWP